MADGAAGGHDRVLAPSFLPAQFDLRRQSRRFEKRDPLAQQRAEHAMHQPPRPAVDQGRAVATKAWSGVPSPAFWASARRRTIRALLSSGSRWRVRRIDHSVEVGQPAQSLAGDGDGERRILGRQLDALRRRIPASGPAAARHRACSRRRGAHRGLRHAPSANAFRSGGAGGSSAPRALRRRSRRPASRSSTAVTIGMSMPRSSAIRRSTGAVKAPSATVRRSLISSATERPSAIALPSEKLRELVEEQVSTRSPSPAMPASVSTPGARARGRSAPFRQSRGRSRRRAHSGRGGGPRRRRRRWRARS